MGLITKISLRNILRQKRRSLFLGIGIGFGMMILVIANSFSHGMVDVLINDVISYAFGHTVVSGNVGSSYYSMISDKERVLKAIKESVPEEDIVEYAENLGIFGRGIGNGEADNIFVVGVKAETEDQKEGFFEDFFTLVEGDFENFNSKSIKYPIIISETKARSLNVGLGDTVNARVPSVLGQMKAVRLTIIAVANANNSFMDIVLFMAADRVKEVLDYKPWQSADIQLTLKNPKQNAKKYADAIHKKLKPNILSIVGQIKDKDTEIFAYKNSKKEELLENIEVISGDPEEALDKKGIMVSKDLARELDLEVGEEFEFSYMTKYRGKHTEKFELDGVFKSDTKLGKNIVLLNEEAITKKYNRYLPKNTNWDYIKESNELYDLMALEWKLFDRSEDNKGIQQKYKKDRKEKSNRAKLDVITMYEGASQILQMEQILNLITVFAGMILFFIILIGVINSLRMTIKDRTREIGTIRAIGMQKRDVRNVFIMETFLLTLFSCIVGIIAAIGVMKALSSLELKLDNALSMILKDGHIFFKINPQSIAINLTFILLIAIITAYFPARRAAKMSAADALRHYE
ncbi:MAG: ABC transporter permease [Fusobacteriota bacterium]